MVTIWRVRRTWSSSHRSDGAGWMIQLRQPRVGVVRNTDADEPALSRHPSPQTPRFRLARSYATDLCPPSLTATPPLPSDHPRDRPGPLRRSSFPGVIPTTRKGGSGRAGADSGTVLLAMLARPRGA